MRNRVAKSKSGAVGELRPFSVRCRPRADLVGAYSEKRAPSDGRGLFAATRRPVYARPVLLAPHIERPPEGLARGLLPTTSWVVVAVASAVVLLAVALFVLGVVRRGRRKTRP